MYSKIYNIFYEYKLSNLLKEHLLLALEKSMFTLQKADK